MTVQEKNKSYWYKKVKLYRFNCSVFVAISEDTSMILDMIKQISDYYKKITPKILANQFGLNYSISQKILDILVKNFDVLKKKSINGENQYQIKDSIPTDSEQFINEKLIISITKRFSILKNPFFFIEKLFFTQSISESINSDEIIQYIDALNVLMEKNQQERKLYKIPSSYRSINYSEVIQLIGYNDANLKCTSENDHNQITLLMNNRVFHRFSQDHKDYIPLLTELKQVQSKPLDLRTKFEKKMSKDTNLERIDYNISEEGGYIKILINTDDISKIGEIHQFNQRYQGKFYSFEITNDWYYKTQIQIEYVHPKIEFWIDFLQIISEKEREKYVELVNLEPTLFIKKLKSNLIQFKKHKYIKSNRFQVSIDLFKEILDKIHGHHQEGLFYLINGKLKESDVFE